MWDIIANIIKGIDDFLLWYINDTPLFPHTLDTIAAMWNETVKTVFPLIGEYITLISEYFNP